ncbi:MAG: RNA polymerase sigma factor [Crocinitomicaceae bacterium]
MVDQSLIDLCRKNDRKAQEKLYEYCYVKLMPMCARYHRNEEDARHVLNIGFVKICKNLDKIKKDAPFEAWAKRIIKNTIIDEFRKTKNYTKLIETKEFERELEVKSPKVENSVWSKLETDILMGMLRKLPDVSRKVFNLYVIDGYSHKEIGGLLSISDGTSKWHLSNARKKLQLMVLSLQEAEDKRMWSNG